jgi:FAD/FMN-containing dehydrogenase
MVASGYVTGGRHSTTGAQYGLAADLVIDMTVVTPDGKVVTANACTHRDLFWALRRRCGATFGVILNMTMILNPDLLTLEMAWGAIDLTRNATHFWDAAVYAFTQYPDLVGQGLAGFGSTASASGNASSDSIVHWLGFNLTLAEINVILLPIEQYVNTTLPSKLVFGTKNVTLWPSF